MSKKALIANFYRPPRLPDPAAVTKKEFLKAAGLHWCAVNKVSAKGGPRPREKQIHAACEKIWNKNRERFTQGKLVDLLYEEFKKSGDRIHEDTITKHVKTWFLTCPLDAVPRNRLRARQERQAKIEAMKAYIRKYSI